MQRACEETSLTSTAWMDMDQMLIGMGANTLDVKGHA